MKEKLRDLITDKVKKVELSINFYTYDKSIDNFSKTIFDRKLNEVMKVVERCNLQRKISYNSNRINPIFVDLSPCSIRLGFKGYFTSNWGYDLVFISEMLQRTPSNELDLLRKDDVCILIDDIYYDLGYVDNEIMCEQCEDGGG